MLERRGGELAAAGCADDQLEDEYRVRVNMKADPIEIEQDFESVIRPKSAR